MLKKIIKPKFGHVSALTRGRYDTVGHYLSSKRQHVQPAEGPLFYRLNADNPLRASLSTDAEQALNKGPFSVHYKTACSPSGDKGDYFSGAPYWWPNPETSDGLPYVRRDCDRIPNTNLYSPESESYDRTSLQRLIDSVTALTFAGGSTNHKHAAFLLRHWFLDAETSMNPNMRYAQVRVGIDIKSGAPSGLIEARDISLLPDCIRMLSASGALSENDVEGLKGWFSKFLLWYRTAPQALKERRTGNNHATNYDLLTLSLLTFVGDVAGLKSHATRSLKRLAQQFMPDGDQPAEAKRPHVLHYCTYNLQSWVLAARVLGAAGADVSSAAGPIFERAAHHLWLRYLADPSQAGREDFEVKRLVPLFLEIRSYGHAGWIDEALLHPDLQNPPEVFHPFTGVPPYWRLVFA